MSDANGDALKRRLAKATEAEKPKTPEELQKLEDLKRKKLEEDEGDTTVAQAVDMA